MTSTLAYYASALVTAVESFIVHAHAPKGMVHPVNIIKLLLYLFIYYYKIDTRNWWLILLSKIYLILIKYHPSMIK